MSKLRLTGSTSGFTELTAPAVAGSNTLTLPTSNGTAGQFLQTNGSGALSFAGAGKILQVAQVVKTDVFSASTASGAETSDITGLSVSLTPQSSSNKILICMHVNSSIDSNPSLVSIYRNSAKLTGATGDADGIRQRTTVHSSVFNGNLAVAAFMFLDSPASTSAQTYTVRIFNPSSITRTIFVNQDHNDANSNLVGRTASTIILMEVAG